MIGQQKRGQGILAGVLGAIILGFILIIGIVSLVEWNKSSNIGESIKKSTDIVGKTTVDILTPILGFLLNFEDNSPGLNFLKVLVFILISVIIVSTLDSVNIFGEDKKGGIINLAIGIIVSIIGIRFMPAELWPSLTAPSSAFVAVIVLSIPFVALFFVTMKIKYSLANKLLWILFIVFTGYLIVYSSSSRAILIVYIIFLILAGFMMFFDSTIRRYWYREMHKKEIQDTIGKLDVETRYSLRRQIERLIKIESDTKASREDIAFAKDELTRLIHKYGDLSSI